MKSTTIRNLLQRVALRARLASLGVRFYQAFLAAAGLYVLGFVAARLSLIPDVFAPWTLLAVPAAALLAALVLQRGPRPEEAARLVDAGTDSKDLFLTATLLEGSAGDFQPLVLRDAEAKAATVSPGQVVRYDWRRRGSTLATVMAVLALGVVFWTHSLDPFGKGAERQKEEQRKQLLAQEMDVLKVRAEVLRQQDLHAQQSPRIEQLMEEIKHTFNQMDPRDKMANLQRLSDVQKILGQEWQKKNEEKLKESLSSAPLQQRFGGESQKSREIKEQLKQGDAEPMKREIEQAQKLAQELAQERDPMKKQELRQALDQKMQDLAGAAQQGGGAKALAEALQRASQQMKMSDLEGLNQESLEAMQQALELSKMEAEAQAQSARDLEALEQALQTIQQAKRANDQEALDGEACEPCNSMADYQALFESLCQGGNGGEGGGSEGPMAWKPGTSEDQDFANPGPGIGGGPGAGFRDDDPTAQTNFTPEQSRSQLTQGRILLNMPTEGENEDGQVSARYREAVAELKQGVDQAIVREQIPPGHRDVVKRYFDTMGEPDAKR